MTAIHNLREHYKLLEKENAELKAHCKAVDELSETERGNGGFGSTGK